jgi:hypothetical protein
MEKREFDYTMKDTVFGKGFSEILQNARDPFPDETGAPGE